MKTANELLEIYEARDDWKHLKLWGWAYKYESKMIKWNNIFPLVNDDRRLYINIYKQVYDALDSLPDNPNSWVCCAIVHEMMEVSKKWTGFYITRTEGEELGFSPSIHTAAKAETLIKRMEEKI